MNVYEIVTERIINELEQGVIPWHKPWISTGKELKSVAFNRITKKPYSLLNQMLLGKAGEYATFKQWSDLGGKVRKGEKASFVVFWKIENVQEKTKDKDGNEQEHIKSIPILKYYNVFHISQIDGVEELKTKELETTIDPAEAAEAIRNEYAQRENLSIKNTDSDRAFYSPSGDYISIPLMKQFKDVAEYYSTLFHEMTHSTGHSTRLNRLNSTAFFGNEEYSKEELVAELGAAALVNHTGLETKSSFKNSTAYIQSWLSALRNDSKLIVSASSKAEKAVNYILTGNITA